MDIEKVITCLLLCVGCGGDLDLNQVTNPPSTFLPAGIGGYPATRPAFPTLSTMGPILSNPNIIVVYFNNESNYLDSFFNSLVESDWWDQVTNGYCSPTNVCPQRPSLQFTNTTIIPNNSLNDNTLPSADSSIRDLIVQLNLPINNQDIYVLMLPSSVSVNLNQTQNSCVDFLGYHYWAQLGNTYVQYAIIPDCNQGDNETITLSHELIEATTDPLPNEDTGYYMQDVGWLNMWGNNGEVADLCNYAPWYQLSDEVNTYNLTHVFNNILATDGLNPCQPNTGLYFNTAPENQSYTLQVGQQIIVNLYGYSTAAMDDWSVSLSTNNNELTIINGSFNMNNGEVATVIMQANAVPSSGVAYYQVHSTSGSITNNWGASLVITQ